MMTDKQIIIDYENICENYSKEVGCYNTFDGSCIKEQCFTYRLLQLLKAKEQECEELKKKIKEIKNVLSISYDLWMYHIANGIGNSDNKNAVEALEDFSVAIRLLSDTLGESEGYLSYSTNKSKIYEQRKELLQKMNEAQLWKETAKRVL